MLMRLSELGCRALIEIAFESISVRRQVGYLTGRRMAGRSQHVCNRFSKRCWTNQRHYCLRCTCRKQILHWVCCWLQQATDMLRWVQVLNKVNRRSQSVKVIPSQLCSASQKSRRCTSEYAGGLRLTSQEISLTMIVPWVTEFKKMVYHALILQSWICLFTKSLEMPCGTIQEQSMNVYCGSID